MQNAKKYLSFIINDVLQHTSFTKYNQTLLLSVISLWMQINSHIYFFRWCFKPSSSKDNGRKSRQRLWLDNDAAIAFDKLNIWIIEFTTVTNKYYSVYIISQSKLGTHLMILFLLYYLFSIPKCSTLLLILITISLSYSTCDLMNFISFIKSLKTKPLAHYFNEFVDYI